FDPTFGYIFNSYYEAVGPRHERPKRGLLSRPPHEEVMAYRRYVDDCVLKAIDNASEEVWKRHAWAFDLALNHEQQHQELMLTDIKHVFSCNPLHPAYAPFRPHGIDRVGEMGWLSHDGGLVEIGHQGEEFAYDNEGPRHQVWLEPFAVADRLVTNGEYLEFIKDGGYERFEFWLSDGFATVRAQGWKAPLYWQQATQNAPKDDASWQMMTLAGLQPLDAAEPVCHVSFYEADAYARWAGKRLPREAEWEIAAAKVPCQGNFADSRHFRPLPATGPLSRQEPNSAQFFGDVWEWTSSPYTPYPGFQPAQGPAGEYNGKFMCNQMVLKGGSCVTPSEHVRASYRNFFYPRDRWQFSGIRLATDC
ncbi:MAG: ergothioneine biosynthesis protein EgtB, partial [Rhodospirillaceae bacterium]|nr:ergothioneine biosynthesis protein EgtB [Rhodospirillaceae bacterium]